MALRGRASTTDEPLGHLVPGQVGLAVGAHVVDVDLDPGGRLDHGHHPLAEALVGHAEHGAGVDAGCLEQHPLDLGGVDVGAAADDHQALAVAEVEVAVVVEEADVAGVQLAAGERLGGGVGALPVAEHQAVPVVGGADADLAGLARRAASRRRRRRCARPGAAAGRRWRPGDVASRRGRRSPPPSAPRSARRWPAPAGRTWPRTPTGSPRGSRRRRSTPRRATARSSAAIDVHRGRRGCAAGRAGRSTS